MPLELKSCTPYLLEWISVGYKVEKKMKKKALLTYLEDGCLGVLVNGNNDLAVFHASQMLNGSANAHSNIKVGSDNLSGLANLQESSKTTTTF